jgi:hypothetical protein
MNHQMLASVNWGFTTVVVFSDFKIIMFLVVVMRTQPASVLLLIHDINTCLCCAKNINKNTRELR